MAQDIRQLFEEERKRPLPELSEGHEDRFLNKLEAQFPQKKNKNFRVLWFRSAAASLVLLIAAWGGFHAWKNAQADVIVSPGGVTDQQHITLSDISPDLKKVENYFISSINVELANLKANEEEKEMVDAYLVKIKELGKEYDELNQELNTIGVNEMTITALIENLKIRLQLLHRLKKNLNHSKNDTYEKDSSDNI